MWIRYTITAVIAFLLGVILGSYLIPTVRLGGQPAIAVFEPITEGVLSWRFAVANPRTQRVTVYEVDETLRTIGSAKY